MSDAPTISPAAATATGETPNQNPGNGSPALSSPDTPVDAGGYPELSQLEALAAKRGLVLEGGKITAKERAEFRAWKRSQQQAIEQRERELLGKVEGTKAELREQIEFAQRVTQLADDHDFDGLAKLLRFENWDGLQAAYASRLTDPNYRQLRELQEERRQRKEREEQEARSKAENERRTRLQQAQATYREELSASCAQSANKIVRSLAKDPDFLAVVSAIQREEYDPRTQTTVTPEQALELVGPRRQQALSARLKELREALNSAFEEERATEEQEQSTMDTKKPTTQTKRPVSRTGVTPKPAPTGGKSVAELIKSGEWTAHKRQRYAQATKP